jgi:hypothetical protein
VQGLPVLVPVLQVVFVLAVLVAVAVVPLA